MEAAAATASMAAELPPLQLLLRSKGGVALETLAAGGRAVVASVPVLAEAVELAAQSSDGATVALATATSLTVVSG